ncbi:MAG: cell division protein ZapA [Gemmatimonadetes bacterium]|nr:cell division protein ZapA [Gemmatimonadota bacterium]
MSRVQSVKLDVQGESYTIRSDAPPEHMREVAAYVDQAIAKVRAGAPSLDPTRAAVLAAMQMADELLRARTESGALSADMQALADEVRRLLPPAKRQTPLGMPAITE